MDLRKRTTHRAKGTTGPTNATNSAAAHATALVDRRGLIKRAGVIAAVATGATVLGGLPESASAASVTPATGNLFGLIWDGTAYPARPSASTVLPGLAQYVGPTQPADWLASDVWIRTPSASGSGPSLLQSTNGNGSGGTNTFSFTKATTAGSTLVVMLNADAGSTFALPAGWQAAGTMPAGAGHGQAMYIYPNAPAGITSVTVECSTTDFTAWMLAEFAMPAGTAAIDWNAQYTNYPNWTSSTSYNFATGKTPAAPGGLVFAQVNGSNVTAPGWNVIGDGVTFTGLWQVAGSTPVVIDVASAKSVAFAIDVTSVKA
jgi:hypothetical protein